ncbi:Na/Pi cotransporter family protein [Paenibacillus endoradicis]|uniref:Na/Pi cotransporter family protein n=1 Tax=Paenibacillus endoradicis TaxID=2972487 RepID=UPI0021592AE0|nr:Na/Pi cotransporter family protein [Paenibacillus endoradicis]MCR8660021.1 Na/Pi cotransporter family protein [Paenibacillus endoradicis]
MSIQDTIFHIVGGIAIFLFGIKYLSDGLQKTAGDNIRHWLATYTFHPLLGVLVGILITILFQSSTGAIILIIGLMNANILSLRQAISVLIGANIGTTVTIFMVGIDVESYALPIITVGVILLLFVHYKRLQYIGQVVFGFGALFLGLSITRNGLQLLSLSDYMTDFMLNLSDVPLFGIITGIVLTLLFTSSNAAIGVLQTIANEGLVQLDGAILILLGSNIGSAVIACIAVIGATIKAKRVVFLHVIYYVCGTTIFLLLQHPIYSFIEWIGKTLQIKMQLATAHGIFQLITGIIFIIFTPLLIKLANTVIQTQHTTAEVIFGAQYLDKRLLATPSVALGQAQYEVIRMGTIARETLMHASHYFFEQDSRSANLALKKETLVNELDHQITDYMVRIHQHGLTAQESEKATGLLHIVNDFERIGDHADNVVELADYCIRNRLQFSKEALEQLHTMFDAAEWIISRVIYALEQNDRSAAADVLGREADLDRMELEFRTGHFKRLHDNRCKGNAGAIFLDVLSNLERIGDHSKNIAEYVLK